MAEGAQELGRKLVLLVEAEAAARVWLEGLFSRMGFAVEQQPETERLEQRLAGEPPVDLLLINLDLLGADYHQAVERFGALKLGGPRRPAVLLLSSRRLSEEARERLGAQGAGAILAHRAAWTDLMFAANRLLFPKLRELRRYGRVFGGFPVVFEQGGKSERAKVYNISQDGAFIECEQPPPEGSRLQLAFELPGSEPLRVEARVNWVNPAGAGADPLSPPGMGIRFITLSEGDSLLLARFIGGRLEQEAGPEGRR